MNKRFIKFLEEQLPDLVRNNVLTIESAGKIRDYYRNRPDESSKNTILTIIGSLAAILIGSGIILLFAYNWKSIPRNIKTILSFIPLIAGQILVYYSWIKKKSTAWTESSSLFLSLAIGSVIALISQIYHLPGDVENFLLIWMLLIFPLNYLTGTIGSLVIYLAGILFWSGFSQAAEGHALYYWLLLGGVVPKLILLMKKEPLSNRTAVVSALIAVNLLIGTGISLEKVVPGLWIPVYGSLLVLFYLIGSNYSGISFKFLGSAGIVFLSYLFTFEFFWEDTGLNKIRNDISLHKTAALFDYLILVVFIILIIYFLTHRIKKVQWKTLLPFTVMFVLALLSFLLGSLIDALPFQIIIFNIYTLFLGIWIIYRGINKANLFQTNLGMLTVLLIIVTRFFDIDIGFTMKGIIFILLGILFLTANKYLSRKLSEGGKS